MSKQNNFALQERRSLVRVNRELGAEISRIAKDYNVHNSVSVTSPHIRAQWEKGTHGQADSHFRRPPMAQ